MSVFIIKFSLGLLAFWLLYVLLLERQSNHHFKRFYLLGALLISGCLPLITITTYIDPLPISNIPAGTFITDFSAEPVNSEIVEEAPFNWSALLWSIYFAGVAVFSLRFLKNLANLVLKINTHERQAQGSFIYVLLKRALPPHSFFNYLFLNRNDLQTENIPKEVILHEQTHARQLHSLDVLLIEIIQIVLWFNPLIYLFKHHIKLNHEFLADQAVLNQGVQSNTYQNILLDYLSHQQNIQLSSSIQYSSIKKRILIMTTKTPKKTVLFSRLLILPLMVVLFYNFAERKYVEKESNIGISSSENTDYPNQLFYVTLENKGDIINLKCENGCKWANLDLEPRQEPYIINDYGFSQGNSIASDEFAFSILVNEETVVFNGLKGTAWELLNFDLQKNEKIALNELGTTKVIDANYEDTNRIDLKIRAINDELFVNDHKIPVENYSEVLNGITRNWTVENHKASAPDLVIDNCSQDFLDVLDQEFRKSDYFAINIQGSKQPNYNQQLPNQQKPKTKAMTIRQAAAGVWLDSATGRYRNTSFKPKDPLRGAFQKQTQDFETSIYVKNPNTNRSDLLKSAVDIISGFNREAESKSDTGTFIKQRTNKDPSQDSHEVKTGFIKINGKTYYYTKIDQKVTYYNREGYKIDKYGKPLKPTVRTHANHVLPNQRVTKVYKDDQLVVEFATDEAALQGKQKGASKEQMAAYNSWAKKMTEAYQKAEKYASAPYPMIKLKEVEQYQHIYEHVMTTSQRQKAVAFPNIVPPPPPATPKSNGKKYTIQDIVVTGNTSFNSHTIIVYSRLAVGDEVTEGGEKIKNAIAKLMSSNLFKSIDISLINIKGSEADVNIHVVDIPKDETIETPPPPTPPTPPEVLNEVPAPPPPPRPLEHMKELAAKGAVFYYEGKKVSAKKAIDIVSKNETNLNFHVKEKDSDKPIVYITKS